MTEPTERSIPPVAMTAVWPRAISPMKAKLRLTLKMLSALANGSETRLIAPARAATVSITHRDWGVRRKFFTRLRSRR